MTLQLPVSIAYQMGHVSTEARLLTGFCGVALLFWSILKLRRRSALVPTCSLFLTVGLIFISFAIYPNAFDRVSYLLGVKYPPVLYLIGCTFVLILMIVHLAGRLASTDERCRRLAQELALLQVAWQPAAGVEDANGAARDIALLQSAVLGAEAGLPIERPNFR